MSRAQDEPSDDEEEEVKRPQRRQDEGEEDALPPLTVLLPAFGTIQFPLPNDRKRIADDLERWMGEDNVPEDERKQDFAWLERAVQRVVLLLWDAPGSDPFRKRKGKLYYLPLSDFISGDNEKYQPYFGEWKDNEDLNVGYNFVHEEKKLPVYNSMPYGEKRLSFRSKQHIDATNTSKQFYISGPIASANQRGGYKFDGYRLDDFIPVNSVRLHVTKGDDDEVAFVGGIPVATIARITNKTVPEIQEDALDRQLYSKGIYIALVKQACSVVEVTNGSMCSLGGTDKRDRKQEQAIGLRDRMIAENINLPAMLSLSLMNTRENWRNSLGEDEVYMEKLEQVFFPPEVLQDFYDFIRRDKRRAIDEGFLTDVGWNQDPEEEEEE